jgi:beta-lactamase regulating signal transducer with metallopeptidase domain
VPTVATQAFPTLISSLVWLSLLHATWIGLVIAASVAWLFQSRGKISHQVRHDVLMLSLGLVVVVPVVFAAMQIAATDPSKATSLRHAIPFVAQAETNPELHRDSPAVEVRAENDSDSSSSTVRILEAILVRGVVLMRASQAYGLVLWGSACLVGFLTLAFSLKGINRLIRDSVAAEEPVIARAEQLARIVSLRRIPLVRVHPKLDQPCLCGILRPAIILPEAWLSTAGPEMLDAVLAHELAHSKRLDPLWNGLQRLLDIALFFHPGVRWLSRSLRREREIAADSLAVQITGDPLALARALESVGRLCVGHRTLRHVGAAFRGQDPTLLPRIQELLGMTPTRPRFQVWPFAAFSSAVVLALVTASVGFAQDETTTRQQTRRAADEAPVISITFEDYDRQICYEVRFIETDADIWRETLSGKLKPLPNQAKIGHWIVDGKDSFEQLIKSVTAQPTSRMTIAPKATAFEAMHLVIRAETRFDGQILSGTKIVLWGTWLPAAVRMSIDLSDSMKTSPRQDPGEREEKVDQRLKDSYDIPDGSSLVLSLDRVQRFVEKRNMTSERLIVITPRRIDRDQIERDNAIKASSRAGEPAKP